jgi:AcrR family transcriptional regulator
MAELHEMSIAEPCRAKVTQVRAAACELFLANGFLRTSMDQVAARANVSKTTLYAHFANKEALFLSVLEEEKRRLGLGIPKDLPDGPVEVRECLGKIATSLLDAMTHPTVMGLFRLVIAECGHAPALGRTMWEDGPAAGRRSLMRLMTYFAEQGQLVIDDSDLAAGRFLALVRGDFSMRCLMDSQWVPSRELIASHVERSLDFFLRNYAATEGANPIAQWDAITPG